MPTARARNSPTDGGRTLPRRQVGILSFNASLMRMPPSLLSCCDFICTHRLLTVVEPHGALHLDLKLRVGCRDDAHVVANVRIRYSAEVS